MKFDKGTMTTLLTAGVPLVAGGVGAYMASRSHQKSVQRQQENLHAVGKDLLTSAAFGRSLPVAQERFIELASLAPRAMQQRSIAAPLLLAAVGGKEDFASLAQRATSIERNLSVTGVSPDLHRSFASGIQLGDKLLPMVLDISKLSPSAQGTAPQDVRYVALHQLMADDQRPIEKRLPSYFNTTEGEHELFRAAENLARNPHELLQATQRHAETSDAYKHLRHIEDVAVKASGNKKHAAAISKVATLELSKTASAQAIGDIMATQYMMIKAASDMHKLSFEFSKAFKDALIYAGTAALGGAALAGIDKAVDTWGQHKMQGQLDASFDTAFKRVQKGNAEDRYAEEVRVKIENDPVRYRQMAREAFDVLAETSPTMARHPIVARSFINSVITNDGAMPAQDLTTFSKIHDSTFVHKPLSERILPAFRAFGGETAMASAVQDAVRTPWRETERQWNKEDQAASITLQDNLRRKSQEAQAALQYANTRKAQEAQAALQYANARKLKNLEHKTQVANTSDTQRHQIALERLRGHMRRVGAPPNSTPISAAQAYNRYKKDIEGNP